MSFNRRRAALACTYCRHRKRRCDATKPRCRACVEAEVDCQYDDAPTQRIDTSGGTREILARLCDIEALLQDQSQSLDTLLSPSHATPSLSGNHVITPARADSIVSPPSLSSPPGSGTSPTSHEMGSFSGMIPIQSTWADTTRHSQTHSTTPAQHQRSDVDVDMSSNTEPMNIPVQHKTSSSYLLGLPAMKALVGEYPTDIFTILESRTPLPSQLRLDGPRDPLPVFNVSSEVLDTLVADFFALVHPCHPFLDRTSFQRLYEGFLSKGPDDSIETACCMVVFALGAVATSAPCGCDNVPAGAEFMQFALPVLLAKSMWSFSYSLLLAQTLALASIYFAYIVRPLHSWRLIYLAATTLQSRLSGYGFSSFRHTCRNLAPAKLTINPDDSLGGSPAPSPNDESTLRLFWSAFLIECDRLAELELPRSGLPQLTDTMALPTFSGVDSFSSTCFLAEVSIRRLLNRVHNSLFNPWLDLSTTSLSTPSLGTTTTINGNVCSELHRQLDLWHASIPAACRPPLEPDTPAGNDRIAVLRIRYFAARHIIYRPFVLALAADVSGHSSLLHQENTPNVVSVDTLEKAAICIESCRRYLKHTTEILDHPSQYTWTFSLSSLGAAITLTLAWLCVDLRALVPDIDELQSLAIGNIRPWSSGRSSLGEVIRILEDMQRKTQFRRGL